MIEIEKIRTIRKRARTTLADCEGCGSAADFVSLNEAGKLFEIDTNDLLNFIRQNNCHFYEARGQRIYLCVPSMLERMQNKHDIRHIGANGE